MGEIKLLPCPFCGADRATWADGQQRQVYGNEQVYCSWCYALAAPEATKEEAARNWNVRRGKWDADKVVESAS